jgi:hypothetical protein
MEQKIFEVEVVVKGSFKIRAVSEADFNAKTTAALLLLNLNTLGADFEVESEEGTAELFLKE